MNSKKGVLLTGTFGPSFQKFTSLEFDVGLLTNISLGGGGPKGKFDTLIPLRRTKKIQVKGLRPKQEKRLENV